MYPATVCIVITYCNLCCRSAGCGVCYYRKDKFLDAEHMLMLAQAEKIRLLTEQVLIASVASACLAFH